MSSLIEQERLISHACHSKSIDEIVQAITEKINQNKNSYYTPEYQLEVLQQLQGFDFGLYLMQNQGINGYWTHYMLTHPWFGAKTGKNNRGEDFTELESFILNKAPLLLATQERFAIFLKENQKMVKNKATLACIPCGMMGELLYLDYSELNEIELVGLDYDQDALIHAELLATQKSHSGFLRLAQQDAWALEEDAAFDLISSNGLNIYEDDPEKLEELYRRFFCALKPGGKLVTSFLTPPPTLTDQCEWDMSKINLNDLMLQKLIFVDLIETKFQNYQCSWKMKSSLASIGYVDIEIIYDKARMFPTIVAYKA